MMPLPSNSSLYAVLAALSLPILAQSQTQQPVPYPISDIPPDSPQLERIYHAVKNAEQARAQAAPLTSVTIFKHLGGSTYLVHTNKPGQTAISAIKDDLVALQLPERFARQPVGENLVLQLIKTGVHSYEDISGAKRSVIKYTTSDADFFPSLDEWRALVKSGKTYPLTMQAAGQRATRFVVQW